MPRLYFVNAPPPTPLERRRAEVNGRRERMIHRTLRRLIPEPFWKIWYFFVPPSPGEAMKRYMLLAMAASHNNLHQDPEVRRMLREASEAVTKEREEEKRQDSFRLKRRG